MKLKQILKDTARRVRALEKKAEIALYEKGDKETYTSMLHQKSQMLVQLPQMCAESLEEVSPEVQSFVRDKIGGISFSAEKALQLKSIFYMSALLYPEGYKKGDPNDLENCIEALESFI